MITILYLDK